MKKHSPPSYLRYKKNPDLSNEQRANRSTSLFNSALQISDTSFKLFVEILPKITILFVV